MNVVETLQAEHAELSGKLSELDERVKTERPALVGQIAQLTRAINALTKPANVPGTRKPMSPEAKERIRAGLEKARAAKAAGAKADEAPVAALPAATPDVSSKKLPVADKLGSRAN